MNVQQQKAVEALERQREKEQKQRLAMMYRLMAYAKLHFDGTMLPYRVLYDLEKQEHEGTFKEIPPNPYYPNPAMTLKTKWSILPYTGDYKGVAVAKNGLPNFQGDIEYKKKYEEYEQRVEAEKMPVDKWGYWYARFLLPYDLSSFDDFAWWGELPKTEEEREVIGGLKAACLEIQADCRENPQNYNTEPVLRKEEHRKVYDVPYGYI